MLVKYFIYTKKTANFNFEEKTEIRLIVIFYFFQKIIFFHERIPVFYSIFKFESRSSRLIRNNCWDAISIFSTLAVYIVDRCLKMIKIVQFSTKYRKIDLLNASNVA